ncbi:MAG: YbhB/YbcL family Raf kinase inhibitor-like protein [Candidatus Omnitrophota bacterium]|nr:YbhB/YbcL family Raf kinase inhibitor-like protein [Candidatus Omnitrophota bacterium]
MKKIIVIFLGIILTAGIAVAEESNAMKLTSPEFENNSLIPKKFTCRGENVNPELVIKNIPEGARRLALIVDDLDASSGNWSHWVVFNIPVVSRIEENSAPGIQGVNDFEKNRYVGPCPPLGTHRYVFKIYALDTEFDLQEGIDKKTLENSMQGHILARAELTGLFKK